MAYLIALVVSLAFFVGFIILTIFETKVDSRVLEGPRSKLDRQAAHMFFIAQHVDWPDFLAHTVRSLAVRIVHDIAYASLAFVRFIERQLTRMIRYMRDRRPNVLAPTPSRESVIAQATTYVRRRTRNSAKKTTDAEETEETPK